MKRFFVVIILIIAANCALAQVKHTVTKSTIAFQIKNMGINTGGNIGGLQADINFSKDKPEASSITATADVNTINTDNDKRDTHLKSADFFDVAKYPKITMKSVSIKHKSGNNYLGGFNVTIKDKTNLVNVPFSYTANGTTAIFNGSFKIKRSDYGIGSTSLVLGNDVTITINIETTQ
jgi:polyisoprenoid-binding protein YceI